MKVRQAMLTHKEVIRLIQLIELIVVDPHFPKDEDDKVLYDKLVRLRNRFTQKNEEMRGSL